MAYPHVFRPSTTVTVNDARGHVQADILANFFRPLLAVSTNGPQSAIVGHNLPDHAAAILRGLVLVPASSLLDIRTGPPNWASGLVPSFVLSEDPRAERWWVTDALPWSYAGGTLYSVYATKDMPLPPPPVPPVPPVPPTPVSLSPLLATAPALTPGVPYTAVIPPTSTVYGYWPVATGVGDFDTVVSPTPVTVGSTLLGGSHLGITFVESAPLAGTGTVSVVGGAHTGPDAIVQVSNASFTPQFYSFTVG